MILQQRESDKEKDGGAMRLRRRSGAVPAEPCFTVSGLRPPAAIADSRGTLRPTFTCRTLKPPLMRGHRQWLKLEGR